MIKAQDAESLATELYKKAAALPGLRANYLICPSSMTATRLSDAGDVPLMTGQGSATDLGLLIHSYHQWGQAISLCVVIADDGLHFWVENDRESRD